MICCVVTRYTSLISAKVCLKLTFCIAYRAFHFERSPNCNSRLSVSFGGINKRRQTSCFFLFHLLRRKLYSRYPPQSPSHTSTSCVPSFLRLCVLLSYSVFLVTIRTAKFLTNSKRLRFKVILLKHTQCLHI